MNTFWYVTLHAGECFHWWLHCFRVQRNSVTSRWRPNNSSSGRGVTESTWYVGHYLAYCTSSGWLILMNVEQSVELELAGEIEVLGENLPQCRFVHHKYHMTWARTRAAAVGSRQYACPLSLACAASPSVPHVKTTSLFTGLRLPATIFFLFRNRKPLNALTIYNVLTSEHNATEQVSVVTSWAWEHSRTGEHDGPNVNALKEMNLPQFWVQWILMFTDAVSVITCLA
jgi:hypothetical protein